MSGGLSYPSRLARLVVPVGLLLAPAIGLAAACTSGGPSATSPLNGSANNTPPGASPSVTAAPEVLVPGDIPDTTAYIPYINSRGGYRFVHPEGWVLNSNGTSATFTDKYNGVSASVLGATAPPALASARSADMPTLMASQPAFALISVAPVTLPGGSGVLIVYKRNSPPDPVTGRSVRQEVHRYEIYRMHRAVALDLFGAVGADNVDPYTRMSQSLRIS